MRWHKTLTRITILALLILAIYVGRDALLKNYLVVTMQSTVGAKVQIERVRSSIADNKLTIKGLTISDPRNPMRNLFQADIAVVEFDRKSLLRRRVRIVDALSTQIVFGSPRLSPGSIETPDNAAITDENTLLQNANRAIVNSGGANPRQSWLDRFQYAAPKKTTGQTGRVSLTADRIFENLQSSIANRKSQVEQLNSKIQNIHSLVESNPNPLRQKQLLQAQQKLQTLRDEIDSIGYALTELDQVIAAGKQELKEIHADDVRLSQSLVQDNRISGETLSGILLNQELAEQAARYVSLYRAIRDAIPDPAVDFTLHSTQGHNVFVPGFSEQPEFTIDSIEMDGETRLAGQKFNFSGHAKNISLAPGEQTEPTIVQLRAQGHTHLVVDAVLDRTIGKSVDRILVQCPGLALAPRLLGDNETILVEVSPSRSKINVNLTCNDNQLRGHIKFDYDNLVMQIKSLDKNAGGLALANEVNLGLASINHYQVVAKLEGDLLNPQISVESDLGEQFAAKLNPLLKAEASVASHGFDQELRESLERLESEYSEEVRKLAYQLENDIIGQQAEMVARLQEKLKDNRFNRR